MYRTVGMAVIALVAITLPAETSLALGVASGAGKFGASMASVVPAASHVAPKPGGGTATPRASGSRARCGACSTARCGAARAAAAGA